MKIFKFPPPSFVVDRFAKHFSVNVFLVFDQKDYLTKLMQDVLLIALIQ